MIWGRVDLLYVRIVARVCGMDVGADVYVGELCIWLYTYMACVCIHAYEDMRDSEQQSITSGVVP